jgi:hypothetical protein
MLKFSSGNGRPWWWWWWCCAGSAETCSGMSMWDSTAAALFGQHCFGIAVLCTCWVLWVLGVLGVLIYWGHHLSYIQHRAIPASQSPTWPLQVPGGWLSPCMPVPYAASSHGEPAGHAGHTLRLGPAGE